jgi:TM2 domain-containing membrane protein YozV
MPAHRLFRRRAVPDSALAVALLVMVAVTGLPAQELPFKRAVPEVAPGPCVPVPLSSVASDEEVRQALELASTASQALILGERERARDLLARATELDPRSADLAYRYARVLEDLGQRGEAVAAFCRSLALDDTGPDAEDARGRLSALAGPAAEPLPEGAVTAFRRGLELADAGLFEPAAISFGEATALAPDWAAAHYNRGAVLARLGQSEASARALRRYLDLESDPDDALAVSERIGRLQGASAGSLPSPGAALGLGIMPGLGQIYTGRPGLGLSVLALSGGLVAASAWAEEGDDRTFVTPGLYVAGGVALVGALDAYFHARRLGEDGRIARLGPDAAFSLGLLPGLGQFYRGEAGAGFTVLGLAATSAAAAFLYEEGEGRGFFATGLGTAGVVTGLAALEASFDARRRQRGPGALPPDPGAALGLGVFPGLGQFYQGRLGTGLGFLSLAAALTAASDFAECCDRRRYVTPGLGIAGGVTVIGALEAFMDAQRVQQGADAPPPAPGTAFALGLIPGMGQFYTGRPAAGLTVLTLAAGSAATSLLYEEGKGRGLFKEGFIAAGAVTAIGAIEAMIHARGRSASPGGLGAGGAAAPEPGDPVLMGPMLVGGGPGGLSMQLVGVRF